MPSTIRLHFVVAAVNLNAVVGLRIRPIRVLTRRQSTAKWSRMVGSLQWVSPRRKRASAGFKIAGRPRTIGTLRTRMVASASRNGRPDQAGGRRPGIPCPGFPSRIGIEAIPSTYATNRDDRGSVRRPV